MLNGNVDHLPGKEPKVPDNIRVMTEEESLRIKAEETDHIRSWLGEHAYEDLDGVSLGINGNDIDLTITRMIPVLDEDGEETGEVEAEEKVYPSINLTVDLEGEKEEIARALSKVGVKEGGEDLEEAMALPRESHIDAVFVEKLLKLRAELEGGIPQEEEPNVD